VYDQFSISVQEHNIGNSIRVNIFSGSSRLWIFAAVEQIPHTEHKAVGSVVPAGVDDNICAPITVDIRQFPIRCWEDGLVTIKAGKKGRRACWGSDASTAVHWVDIKLDKFIISTLPDSIAQPYDFFFGIIVHIAHTKVNVWRVENIQGRYSFDGGLEPIVTAKSIGAVGILLPPPQPGSHDIWPGVAIEIFQ
jgi:hypothetical protein